MLIMPSVSDPSKIVEAEGRIEQIDRLLVQAASTADSPVGLEEVRKFVETKIGGMDDMLLADQSRPRTRSEST